MVLYVICLSQSFESLGQQAAATASRHVFKPDILEVSRVVVCYGLCLPAEHIIGDTSAQAALITGDDVCYLAYVCGRITPPSVLPEACISTACNEHVFMLGDTGTKHNHSPDTCTLTSTDPQTVFLRVLMIFDMFCFATALCIFQTTSCSSCLQRCSRA